MIEQSEAYEIAQRILLNRRYTRSFTLAEVEGGWSVIYPEGRPLGDSTIVVANDGRAGTYPSYYPPAAAIAYLPRTDR